MRRMIKVGSGILLAFCIILAAVQIYLSFGIDDERVRKDINTLFMGKLGKAVKFDSVRIYFWSELSLSNFSLSRSTDFNDNLPLLRCDSAVVHVRFLELLRRKISLKRITIDDGEINLQKQYGEGYGVFWDNLIPQRKDGEKGTGGDFDFTMQLNNLSLNLRLNYVNDVVLVKMRKIDSNIECHRNSIAWKTKGIVLSRDEKADSGDFDSEGQIFLKNDHIFSGRGLVDTSDIDISYFAPAISEIVNVPCTIEGNGYLKCRFSFINNSVSFSDMLKINGVKLKKTSNKNFQISRDSISVMVNGESIDRKKIRIREFSAHDGNISIKGSGVVTLGDGVRTIAGKYSFDSVDVNDMVSSYSPGLKYQIFGQMSSNGLFSFDANNGICDQLSGDLALNKLVVSLKQDKAVTKLIEGEAALHCNNDSFIFHSAGKHMGESYDASAKTDIRKYRPFSSSSDVRIHIEQTDFSYLWKNAARILDHFFAKVYDDRKKGYEDIRFLSTHTGEFINNNDCSARLDISRITVGGNKNGFASLSATAMINGGMVKWGISSLSGYGGTYVLTGDGFLHSDFPQIKMSGSISNFDIARFCSDNGIAGVD
ncbi:MAG TPA: hypothetical protein VF857_00700, partial [Spirochaetota bacterium]